MKDTYMVMPMVTSFTFEDGSGMKESSAQVNKMALWVKNGCFQSTIHCCKLNPENLGENKRESERIWESNLLRYCERIRETIASRLRGDSQVGLRRLQGGFVRVKTRKPERLWLSLELQVHLIVVVVYNIVSSELRPSTWACKDPLHFGLNLFTGSAHSSVH